MVRQKQKQKKGSADYNILNNRYLPLDW